MLRLWFAWSALLAVDLPDRAAPSAEDVRTYAQARDSVKRNADAHVGLALWCEARGLEAERVKHLMTAVLIDPEHALARGLLGQAKDGEAWRKPAAIEARAQGDPDLSARLAEYNVRRSKAKNSVKEQWLLGLWCADAGLEAEAKAHFSLVTRLDPNHEGARKHLGYRKVNGRWLTDAQVAALKAEAQEQTSADRRWKPVLEKALADIARGGESRSQAEDMLRHVEDPRAVPAVLKVLGKGNAANQARVVQVLGQIRSVSSSRALTLFAVGAESASIRRAASETLRQRDPREYASLLIRLLRDPIKYEVKPVGGPGAPGEITIAGKRQDIRRRYLAPPVPDIGWTFWDSLRYDQNGMPVVLRPMGLVSTPWMFVSDLKREWTMDAAQNRRALDTTVLRDLIPDSTKDSIAWNNIGDLWYIRQMVEAENQFRPVSPTSAFKFDRQVIASIPFGVMQAEAIKAAVATQQQLENDVALLDRYNASIVAPNERVLGLLRIASGQDLGADREAWDDWYLDQVGYSYAKPTSQKEEVVEDILPAYLPQVPVPLFSGPIVSYTRISCFGAGTPVRTLGGSRPIESLQIGDQVLSQNTADGSLSYQPVLAVHHNPPSETLRVEFEGGRDPIISSVYHRFWRPGAGWAMARELKPGDAVRTLDGIRKVRVVAQAKVQRVFNIDVAENRTFFAGTDAALVHDNSLPAKVGEVFDIPKTASLASARAH